MQFSEVTNETPKLAVVFSDEGGKEQFQWGMGGGQLPLLSVIGGIVQTQTCSVTDIQDCPQPMFVMVWDEASRGFSYFIHKSIPWRSLVGMLEVIKFTLISTTAAKQAANQQMILGPDGRPANRRPVIM